jgi:hypothetical protein
MKKTTLFAFVALLAAFAANSALAATYSGKCAKKAEEAAIQFWADVPNPDPNLEYVTVSSKVTAPRSAQYIVVLALSDGNEQAFAKYEVTFEDLSKCAKPSVKSIR